MVTPEEGTTFMMGQKRIQAKLMYSINIEDFVPIDNFYRRVDQVLDLRFLYQECKAFYGTTGNPSLDPVVFFKLLLFGYFEHIICDRELIRRASDSLGVRLYLGYDIDEILPWHSTVSRTRALLSEEVFEKLFTRVVKLCAEAGLIAGTHQSIDSTLVKANASLESIEKKHPPVTLRHYIQETKQANEVESTDATQPHNENPSSDGTQAQLNMVETQKLEKFERRSNTEYVSRTDPESKIAQKPGSPTDLYYTTQYSVDSHARVITDVLTTCADVSDRKSLPAVLQRTIHRLQKFGLRVKAVSADRNYCSGEILRALEQQKIEPLYTITAISNNNRGHTAKRISV
jgi:transposase